ncbi:alpha/beta fold hydrolase [Streptacidiphilus rugosus]|uniref:alpha/beta fold hydrolase n=1 Tax=Streptacidiphilus rugosus TaxID=405783 RepID=UPI00055BFF02|nr:alpha/beta hydrolase [Streptacidiphilus rugosus]
MTANSSSDVFSFESEDGSLVYRDAGTGRPVVLLHSVFVDHTMFDAQFADLAQRYRVIAPDARGHGGSANASRPFRQTDDLAALLRHLELEPAVLVGTSMGALIAVDTALEHPELVRGLVVVGRGTGNPDLTDPWAQSVHDAQNRAMAAGDIQGWIDAWVLWAAGPHRAIDEVGPAIVARLREMVIRTLSKHTPDETDHTVAVENVCTRAKEIAVPVLGLYGDLDAPGLIETVERLMSAVPDGDTVAMRGTAHYPTMERPEEFNRLVEDFLAEVYSS